MFEIFKKEHLSEWDYRPPKKSRIGSSMSYNPVTKLAIFS